MRLLDRLRPLLTARFLKFCAVGASGVVVNLGVLALLTGVGMRSSLASAWAIEVSILSNFAVNELWTFRDQRAGSTLLGRAARFQLVSLVGALVQWVVFLAGNVALYWWLEGSAAVDVYFGGPGSFFERMVQRPILDPPDVGAGVYLAQLAGIGVATGWNFLANFYWTWRDRSEGAALDEAP